MDCKHALAELKYDNEERDWNNCAFDMAQGVYDKCKKALEKQIELQDFIDRLDPEAEKSLIVILERYVVQ